MRSPFHMLLVYLSLFDIVYLLTSQAIFGFPTISLWYEHAVYPVILPVCFGIGHTGRVGSVYLTLSVTIERYFAIVHPLRHVGWKRALAPLSVLFAVAYNVPRFFEFYYDREKGHIVMSALRSNDAYITYYVFWSKFVFIELIPYFTIIVLNSFIICKLYRSTQFRKRFRYRRRRTLKGIPTLSSERRSTSSEEEEDGLGLDVEDKDDIVTESGIALTTFATAPDERAPLGNGNGEWKKGRKEGRKDAMAGACFHDK